MDSSSQLTIAYDILYYVKLAALSIKTISRPLPIIVFADIGSLVIEAIIKFTIYFNIGYKLNR